MFAFLKNKRVPEFLRSGDGDLLEVKEGVVVDAQGKPIGIFQKVSETFTKTTRAFSSRGGLPLTIAAAFAIPVALFAGLAALTLLGGFTTLFVVLMLIESVFGIGVRPNQKRG